MGSATSDVSSAACRMTVAESAAELRRQQDVVLTASRPVGTSATDLPCRGEFPKGGPMRIVGHDRRLANPVDIHAVVARTT